MQLNKNFRQIFIKKLKGALDLNGQEILSFVDKNCKSQPWFVPSLTRRESEETLEKESPGGFLIRLGREKEYLALSFKSGEGEFVHHKILYTGSGWTISGCQKTFLSLSSLVLHHTILREGLPGTLRRNI